MANNKEEAGKGTPRPGEMPAARRPYATIDLRATEVEGRDPPLGAGASRPAASAATDAKSTAKPETKSPEPQPKTGGPSDPDDGKRGKVAAALASLRSRRPSAPLLTHLAAGAAGALLVLAAAQLITPDQPPARPPEVNDLLRRLADIENVLGTRPNSGLRSRVDEMGRSLGAVGETQAKLARDTKALEGKVGSGQEIPQELVGRLAKLEAMLGAMPAADPAGASPQLAALAGRLAELQKAARDAGDTAKSGVARFDSELSAIRTEAGRVAQRLDGLKGEVEERLQGAAKAADVGPLATKLATLERELQAFLKSEADRNANASRIVLTLELANLKRAIDRGQSYAEELARAKKVGGALNFTALERYMLEGVPAPAELAKSFGKAANAMLDAEAERADATLVDRLLSGARGIVRVRKAGHAADDTSAEAVVGRMEAALKDGRLAEVLANAKKLPPKAALAGEDWVRKVQARQAVEQALADVEAALKASLAVGMGTGTATSTDGRR
jgi:hypothetical protein